MRLSAIFLLIFCFYFSESSAEIDYSPAIKSCFFIENKGQIVDSDGKQRNDILYYALLPGMNVYFFKDKISYVFVRNDGYKVNTIISTDFRDILITTYRIDVKIQNNSENVEIVGFESDKSYSNYYFDFCPNGIENVRQYSRIKYKNVYKNIDMIFYFKDNNIKYDLILKDNSNYQEIKFEFLGINKLNLKLDGSLLIETPAGDLIDYRPTLIINEILQNGFVEFIINNNILSYKLNNMINSEFIIDPELSWSTYFGGTNNDNFTGVSENSNSDYAICGFSTSVNYPTTSGVFQENKSGNTDWVISKFDRNNSLIWSTFIGGNSFDAALNCVFDKNDYLWVGGDSRGPGFPVTNDAYQTNYGGGYSDQAIVKLSSDGKRVYATYNGGNEYDGIPGIGIDNDNCIWIDGITMSTNFKTTSNAFQKSLLGSFDATISRFDENGRILLSSYFGGNDHDKFESLIFDKVGNPVVCGLAKSTNINTVNAFQKYNAGDFDVFVAKLNKNSGEPIWSTYLGGSDLDVGYNITKDSEFNYIITGFTSSSNFPTTKNVFQSSKKGGIDYFVSKFSDEGNLIWSTYFGGSGNDGFKTSDTQGGGIVTDLEDNIIFSGKTQSSDFPVTHDAFQNNLFGNREAFVSIIDKDCKLKWSSFLGGSNDDFGYDIVFSKNTNEIIIIGSTMSPDFPITLNAYQNRNFGGYDGFITKILLSNCDSRSFNFENFNNTNNLHLIKDTKQSDTTITLSPSAIWKGGAIWYQDKLPVKKGFTTEFSFRFSEGVNKYHPEQYLGADGIAFVVQNQKNDAIGSYGGALGYRNISNSLAIEYDTYKNADESQLDNFHDPNENHIGVFSNGIERNQPDHLSVAHIATNDSIMPLIPDGRTFYSKIEYNIEPQTLKIWLDSNSKFLNEPVLIINNIDISKLLNLDSEEFAWVGFTSATGIVYEKHELLSWSFCSKPTGAILINVEDSEKHDSNKLYIYPNPASDIINIEYSIYNPGYFTLEVFDMLGNRLDMLDNGVKGIGNQKLQLQTNNYSSGLYYVILRTNETSICRKFSIIK